MKPVDDLLATLRLRSVVNCRAEMRAPWGVHFPTEPGTGKFHFVVEGQGRLEVPGEPVVVLERGDFALVTGGRAHVVRDQESTRPMALQQVMNCNETVCRTGLIHRFGGDGAETVVLSGKFEFDDVDTHPLLRALPPMIVIRGEAGKAIEWLEGTLAFVACESQSNRPGAQAVLDRLCGVLFIQAVRGWVTQAGDHGWPAAVQDPAVARALSLIHDEPARRWTVEALGDQAAMSRSAFAERFRRLVGEPPLQYVTRWRMHQATQLLRDPSSNVATIAERVGYESEAAFAKAFKRMVGHAPGEYRRMQRA